jgi:hypothetical protein
MLVASRRTVTFFDSEIRTVFYGKLVAEDYHRMTDGSTFKGGGRYRLCFEASYKMTAVAMAEFKDSTVG